MEFSLLTGCASRFWHITSGVCRAVGACLGGIGRPATLPDALAMAVHRRVMRAQSLLLALMARVRAGTLLVGRSRVASGLAAPAVARARPASAVVLPRRFGWLVGLVGYEAAGRASQLAALLADPEMVELVRDVPQARRILAPLCRMLGVEFAGVPRLRRVRVRRVVVAVPEVVVAVMARPGYRPSARWPKGVMARGVVLAKRG
jgi:hypothetical protein